MTGYTHIAAAEAAALLILSPADPQTLAVTCTCAMLGGLLPDIDTRASKARRQLDNAVRTIAAIALSALLALRFIPAMSVAVGLVGLSDPQAMTGSIVFMLLCVAGSFCAHRGFTHSLVFCAAQCAMIRLIAPAAFLPFAVGLGSHLLLDVLTQKRVKVFWPFGKGLRLNLCKGDGLFNALLGILSIGAVTVGILQYIGRVTGSIPFFG